MGDTQGGRSDRELAPEVYPSAPLKAVAIELRFSALLDAQVRFAPFQRKHPEFSKLYFASDDGVDDQLARPRTCVLMGPERTRAVAIAPDELSVVTYAYDDGFGGFTSWAVPLLEEGLGLIDAGAISRIRYRYENVISSALGLEKLFVLRLPAGEGATPITRNVHLYWNQTWPNGTVGVMLDACDQATPDSIELAISGECYGAFSVADLQGQIDEAHRMAQLTFEALITPEFRERIREKRS